LVGSDRGELWVGATTLNIPSGRGKGRLVGRGKHPLLLVFVGISVLCGTLEPRTTDTPEAWGKEFRGEKLGEGKDYGCLFVKTEIFLSGKAHKCTFIVGFDGRFFKIAIGSGRGGGSRTRAEKSFIAGRRVSRGDRDAKKGGLRLREWEVL